jgi:hypothetical protein
MSLEALRITECPLAFASFAEKHNALVDLISQIRGANGVTVTISERNGIITGGGTVDTGLTARVATLETLTTGMSRQSVLYCSGGSNTTITILRT